jgi:hypothetical protein
VLNMEILRTDLSFIVDAMHTRVWAIMSTEQIFTRYLGR